MCVMKERWMQKDDKAAKYAYSLFSEINHNPALSLPPPKYDAFVNSRYYDALYKFAKYINDIQAIRPNDFVKFLTRAKVPIDKWTTDFIYDQYVRELNKKETPEAAVERTILLFQQWSQDNDHQWYDFFREVHPNQAVSYIKSGRISPWILYSASSAFDLMENMSDEQLTLVQKYVDPVFWGIKFDQEKEYVNFIKTVLTEYGI